MILLILDGDITTIRMWSIMYLSLKKLNKTFPTLNVSFIVEKALQKPPIIQIIGDGSIKNEDLIAMKHYFTQDIADFLKTNPTYIPFNLIDVKYEK